MATATKAKPMFDEQSNATALVVQPAAPANPMAIIQAAIERGVEPDHLGKLMDLQERYERNRAAEGYAAALTAFQHKCPAVHKSRQTDPSGKLRYKYASFDDVMAKAGPVLAECGIAVSFSTANQEKGIRVTCRLRHGTHCEEHTLDVPIPAMTVNDTQRYGAALSYAKRYALCAALNIVVTDEDDDAQSAYEVVTEEQVIQLKEWCDSKDVNVPKFLAWLGVASLADIPAARFSEALEAVKRK